MNETIWLETATGELLNLSKVAFIKHKVHSEYVEILACFDSEAMPMVLARVKTQKAAQKFLDKIATSIRINQKYINASMFVTQAENEKEQE